MVLWVGLQLVGSKLSERCNTASRITVGQSKRYLRYSTVAPQVGLQFINSNNYIQQDIINHTDRQFSNYSFILSTKEDSLPNGEDLTGED